MLALLYDQPPLTGGIKATTSPADNTVSSSAYSSLTAVIALSKLVKLYEDNHLLLSSFTVNPFASTVIFSLPTISLSSAKNNTSIIFHLLFCWNMSVI